LKIFSAFLVKPGKYESALAYQVKLMTEFFDVEGFTYEFSTWSTIEESLAYIGQNPLE
jgi:hypothetical protein